MTSIAAWLIQTTSYMDADYYYVMSQVLAGGGGLYEPFLWNYLNHPQSIPHPAFQYWMPLTSLLAAASQAIFGLGFRVAQAPFVILTIIIPPLTAWLAHRIHADSRMAWQSGLLALFPGFYLPFLLTIDSFAIYAMLGIFFFLIMAKGFATGKRAIWLLIGFLSGIAHLTRADGGLFLLVPFLSIFLFGRERWRGIPWMLVGYMGIMIPWGMLKWTISDQFFPSGTTRTLWLLEYDELFAYPPEKLNFWRWAQAGIGEILHARLRALWTNIQSVVAVNGLVFLGPLMLLGALKLRREPIVRILAIYWLLLIIVMSFVFPFAGSRGGYFHSSAVMMPALWALAPLGLREAIDYAAHRRGWQSARANMVFGVAAIVLAAMLTWGLFAQRFVGGEWKASAGVYEQVDEWFHEKEIDGTIVAVNNPPGFYRQTGLSGVVIPSGDETALELIVRKYQVEWVLLDRNHPKELRMLYHDPNRLKWLMPVAIFRDVRGESVHLFQVSFEEGR